MSKTATTFIAPPIQEKSVPLPCSSCLVPVVSQFTDQPEAMGEYCHLHSHQTGVDRIDLVPLNLSILSKGPISSNVLT
jgi:hypothetical protein